MHYRAWPSIVGGACCLAGFGVAIAGLPMGDPVGFYTEVSCIIAMGNVAAWGYPAARSSIAGWALPSSLFGFALAGPVVRRSLAWAMAPDWPQNRWFGDLLGGAASIKGAPVISLWLSAALLCSITLAITRLRFATKDTPVLSHSSADRSAQES